MHEYITIEETLVQETDVFKNQVNKVNYNNKKNISAAVKENYEKPGLSRKNTKISGQKMSSRSRSISEKNSTKTNLTESNEATLATSQPTVKKKVQNCTETVKQFQPPMTRIPFQLPTTIDEPTIVKIEQPEITSYNEKVVSASTVLDTSNITELNLSSQSLFSEKTNSVTVTKEGHQFSEKLVTSIENSFSVMSASEQLNYIDQIKRISVAKKKKKRKSSKYVVKKKSNMRIIKSEQNESIDRKLKSQIMVPEPTVTKEHDTNQLQMKQTNDQPVEVSKQQQVREITQYKVKEGMIQNESNKKKMSRQLKEVTVNIKPHVYSLKKKLQKTAIQKESNTRSNKNKFIRFHENNIEKPKMQKTVEEWRLEFNLLKTEKIVLERCDMVVPLTTDVKSKKKTINSRKRKNVRKNSMKTEVQAVESCNNVQIIFNDVDFNLPDPTEITEHYLNYSPQSKKLEIKNLRSNKNGCFDDNEVNIFEYMDQENYSIIKSSLELETNEFSEHRKDKKVKKN